MKIEFGNGRRSKTLEKLILSKPEIFDGFYDQVNYGCDEDGRIYEVSMRFGFQVDNVHSIFGSIKEILNEVRYIEKCNDHNCYNDECKAKRGK